MAQSIGYTLCAFGPLLVGLLHDATGSWTGPLVLLLALIVPQAVSGALAGRNRTVRG
jgi:MFS transporter, CP family, cyanate transporter